MIRVIGKEKEFSSRLLVKIMEGKGNGLTSFKQKGIWKTVASRPDIDVKLANEVLGKERSKKGNGRRYGAGHRPSKSSDL